MLKSCIIRMPDGEENIYFDKNGMEILEGDTVLIDGKRKTVYRTIDGELGTDATNPKWIEMGMAIPCEYGIYPLEELEMENIELVDEH